MSLVTIEGTRARRSEEELINADPSAKVALEALVQGRLLVARDTACLLYTSCSTRLRRRLGRSDG